jgi:hypothetical protein
LLLVESPGFSPDISAQKNAGFCPQLSPLLHPHVLLQRGEPKTYSADLSLALLLG